MKTTSPQRQVILTPEECSTLEKELRLPLDFERVYSWAADDIAALSRTLETVARCLVVLGAVSDSPITVDDPEVVRCLTDAVEAATRIHASEGFDNCTLDNIRVWNQLEDTFGFDRRKMEVEA